MHNVIHCSVGDRLKSPEDLNPYIPQSTLGQSHNVALHIGKIDTFPTFSGLPAQQLILASVFPKTYPCMFRRRSGIPDFSGKVF